jgi:hypothetical protein
VRSYRTFSPLPRFRRTKAVCFLWHFPSTDLEISLPDVIRHTALRSSDFPLSPLDAATATVQSSCQHFIIFDGTPAYGGQVAGQTMHNSRGDSCPRLSRRASRSPALLGKCELNVHCYELANDNSSGNHRTAELRSAGQPRASVPT